MKPKQAVVALVISVLSLGVGAIPAHANDDYLSADQAAFFQEAFGDVPNKEELDTYLEMFGSVPTQAEVEQYVASSIEEEEMLSKEKTTPGLLPNLLGVWSNHYFSYGQWIGRDVWSLSLMPRKYIDPTQWSDSWGTVYRQFNGSRHWSFYKPQGADKSMETQYMCHARYGLIKTPWNLEPSRKPESLNPVTCN